MLEIIDERSKLESCFYDISIGDVFEVDDEGLFIKIYGVSEDYSYLSPNAVNLYDGSAVSFDSDDKVKHVNVRMSIIE